MDAVDWVALRENCAGDESLVDEVVGLFLKEVDGLVRDVRLAVDRADADAVKRSAHKLKGALVSLAAPPSIACARALETMGQQRELGGAKAALADLEATVKALQSALTKKPAP